ncbi:MAG: hypothetical protein ABIV06_05670 [Thermoanaerobaculia bacterium]
MRTPAIVFATFVVAASFTSPVCSAESKAEAPLEFLLSAAAADFQAHHPPEPAQFRKVRLGHVVNSKGETQYVLCGQFLPAEASGKAKWMHFATIKTSAYEQWIAPEAVPVCKLSSIEWDARTDLSESLQSRLDALRGGSGEKK